MQKKVDKNSNSKKSMRPKLGPKWTGVKIVCEHFSIWTCYSSLEHKWVEKPYFQPEKNCYHQSYRAQSKAQSVSNGRSCDLEFCGVVVISERLGGGLYLTWTLPSPIGRQKLNSSLKTTSHLICADLHTGSTNSLCLSLAISGIDCAYLQFRSSCKCILWS